MVPGEKIDIKNIENLIKKHMAFIIRTTSNVTGRYVSVENDDVFSIALEAFCESVKRYDAERGAFLSFARLVIESRVKTFLLKENKREKTESIEAMYETGKDIPEKEPDDMHEEIVLYKQELMKFGLSLEKIADESPKHRDTREKGIQIAKCAGEDKATVELTYRKLKLPIRAVAGISRTTEKIVKRSKVFILGAMLIFCNQFNLIKDFILETR